MNRQLVVLPRADTDIDDAAAWYEAEREGLGGVVVGGPLSDRPRGGCLFAIMRLPASGLPRETGGAGEWLEMGFRSLRACGA